MSTCVACVYKPVFDFYSSSVSTFLTAFFASICGFMRMFQIELSVKPCNTLFESVFLRYCILFCRRIYSSVCKYRSVCDYSVKKLGIKLITLIARRHMPRASPSHAALALALAVLALPGVLGDREL